MTTQDTQEMVSVELSHRADRWTLATVLERVGDALMVHVSRAFKNPTEAVRWAYSWALPITCPADGSRLAEAKEIEDAFRAEAVEREAVERASKAKAERDARLSSGHDFQQYIQGHGITQPRCSCGWQGDYDGAGIAYDRDAWAEHVALDVAQHRLLTSPAWVAQVVRNYVIACGPVTIPEIQAEADDQTNATPYDRDLAITEVLRSPGVEIYDVCQDGIAAFWGADAHPAAPACQCEHATHYQPAHPSGCPNMAIIAVSPSYMLCEECVNSMAPGPYPVTESGPYAGLTWHAAETLPEADAR